MKGFGRLGKPRSGASHGGSFVSRASKQRGSTCVVRTARAHATARARLQSTGAFLLEQVAGWRDGTPVLGLRLSELLRALIRQEIRILFEGDVEGAVGEARGARILATVPRGRGVGFLSDDVNSAAKIVSNALYELHEQQPLLAEPRIASLLAQGRRLGAPDGITPQEKEGMLAFAEAHAACEHVLRTELCTTDTLGGGGAGGCPGSNLAFEMAALRTLLDKVRAGVSETFVDTFDKTHDANCMAKLGLLRWDVAAFISCSV